ncbi:hypothetical protein ACMD2_06908 [Ananas comosus]|uniref:Uncharacterized protein n=1 Tax=Ananas comosus TaxID=4615 RepID=A0A199VYX5_ANACO|nr:hypothetical protein ACMD2_06908 [Ananas comosus]
MASRGLLNSSIIESKVEDGSRKGADEAVVADAKLGWEVAGDVGTIEVDASNNIDGGTPEYEHTSGPSQLAVNVFPGMESYVGMTEAFIRKLNVDLDVKLKVSREVTIAFAEGEELASGNRGCLNEEKMRRRVERRIKGERPKASMLAQGCYKATRERRLTVGRKSGQKGTAERNAGYWGLSHVQFSRRESMDLS